MDATKIAEIKEAVTDGLCAQFSGGYSWENMIDDVLEDPEERAWAKEHLDYGLKETPSPVQEAISELNRARCNVDGCPEHSGTDADSEFKHTDDHIDNAIGILQAL